MAPVDPVEHRERRELAFWLALWRALPIELRPHALRNQNQVPMVEEQVTVDQVHVHSTYVFREPFCLIQRPGSPAPWVYHCCVCGTSEPRKLRKTAPAYMHQQNHLHNFGCSRDDALRARRIEYSAPDRAFEAQMWEATAPWPAEAGAQAYQVLSDFFLERGVVQEPLPEARYAMENPL